MFDARKRLAAEQAWALLRKEHFSAAMKLIESKHTKNMDNVNVESSESAEVEKPAKAASEQSKQHGVAPNAYR